MKWQRTNSKNSKKYFRVIFFELPYLFWNFHLLLFTKFPWHGYYSKSYAARADMQALVSKQIDLSVFKVGFEKRARIFKTPTPIIPSFILKKFSDVKRSQLAEWSEKNKSKVFLKQ